MHNWWRIRALGFHQETTEESRKQLDWFCIKLYVILHEIIFILALFSTQVKYYEFQLRNSEYKTLFSTRGNYFSMQVRNSKPKHYFIQLKEIAANFGYKFKTIDVILMCLEILLHKHKAVINVPGIAKQTVNRK